MNQSPTSREDPKTNEAAGVRKAEEENRRQDYFIQTIATLAINRKKKASNKEKFFLFKKGNYETMTLKKNSFSFRGSSSLLVVFLLLLLLQNITAVFGGAVNCGCPETCTAAALSESNGAPWSCERRIVYLMESYMDAERLACRAASKDPSKLSTEENSKKPCRYEACHPEGCKKDGKNQETTKKEEEKATPVVAKAATTTTPPKKEENNKDNKTTQSSSSSPSSFHKVVLYARGVGVLGILIWSYGFFQNKKSGKKAKSSSSSSRHRNNNNNNSTGVFSSIFGRSTTTPTKRQRVSRGVTATTSGRR